VRRSKRRGSKRRGSKRRGGDRVNYSPAPNRNMPPRSNLQNQMMTFNGNRSDVIGFYRMIMEAANDDIYMSEKQMLTKRAPYIARATAFKAIAQRIKDECNKPDGTVDTINAILTESNLQFRNGEVVKTNLAIPNPAIQGGRIRKGKTKKAGKSRKSRKSKTRRR